MLHNSRYIDQTYEVEHGWVTSLTDNSLPGQGPYLRTPEVMPCRRQWCSTFLSQSQSWDLWELLS